MWKSNCKARVEAENWVTPTIDQSETQGFKFRQLLNSNQLSKITKDHTKDA